MKDLYWKDKEIAPGVPPQKSDKPPGNVIRLKGGQREKCACVSDEFIGFTIHFDEQSRRSMPHIPNLEECGGCQRKMPLKTKWYLHVLTSIPGPNWIEFTDHAMLSFCQQVGEIDTYRGLKFDIRRSPASNGRLYVTLDPLGEIEDVSKIKPQSPEALLRWLWERENRRPRN